MTQRPLNKIAQVQSNLLNWLHVGLEKNLTSEALKNHSIDCSEQSYQLIHLMEKTRNIVNNFIQLMEKFPSVKSTQSEGYALLEQEKIYKALCRTISKLDLIYCAILPTKASLDVISLEEQEKVLDLH